MMQQDEKQQLPLTQDKIQKSLSSLDYIWEQDPSALKAQFIFNDFNHALEFANRVAEVAEKLHHHPTIVIDYTTVGILTTTHESAAVTQKDLDLIEQIENIARNHGKNTDQKTE